MLFSFLNQNLIILGTGKKQTLIRLNWTKLIEILIFSNLIKFRQFWILVFLRNFTMTEWRNWFFLLKIFKHEKHECTDLENLINHGRMIYASKNLIPWKKKLSVWFSKPESDYFEYQRKKCFKLPIYSNLIYFKFKSILTSKKIVFSDSSKFY